MADFRDLARQYVGADSETDRRRFAQLASQKLQGAEGRSALLDWISSVQHWVTFQGDDDDLVSRAKAYEFLAETLEYLNNNFLKADKVGVLLSYFKSIFESDVRGGVRGAVKALSSLMDQEAFKPTQGDEILSSLQKLEKDFKLQDVETRAATYSLVLKVIENKEIASDLQYRHGAPAGFITSIIELVGSERDAKCLKLWFRILQLFLTEYEPSDDVVKAIFDTFSAYYPISLKSDPHPSGLTTENMKDFLRACFASHYRVAKHAIPFLLKRLNEGDGVRATIKLDMLNTLKACVTSYGHPAQSVHPYIDDIWTNLKYEVRNGEVEETIQATLEVIRALAKRLEGKALTDFVLTVQRECVDDLSNPTYTAQAGKLLMAVLSASPEAFAIMVSPIANEIKDQVRRPKSPKHTASLLTLANQVLALRRVILPLAQAKPEVAKDFAAIDGVFVGLKDTYNVLFNSLNIGNPIATDPDTIAITSEIVKGLGLLVDQKTCRTIEGAGPLLDISTIEAVVQDLGLAWGQFRAQVNGMDNAENSELMRSLPPNIRSSLRDVTSNICTSLRACLLAHPPTFTSIMERCDPDKQPHLVERKNIQAYGWMLSDLAYIMCSKVTSQEAAITNYAHLLKWLISVFRGHYEERTSPVVWFMVVQRGFSVAFHSFMNACQKHLGRPIFPITPDTSATASLSDARFTWDDWVPYISKRFELTPIQDEQFVQFTEDTGEQDNAQPDRVPGDIPDLENPDQQFIGDFLLISLYYVRQLYRKVTVPSRTDLKTVVMRLGDSFETPQDAKEAAWVKTGDWFLSYLSQHAQLVISKFSEADQRNMFLVDDIIVLFHGNELFQSERKPYERRMHAAHGRQIRDAIISPPEGRVADLISADRNLRYPPPFPLADLNEGRTYVLGLGILKALHSHDKAGEESGFDGAFEPWSETQMAQRIIIAGLLARDDATTNERSTSYVMTMLTVLGNKFTIEKLPGVIKIVRHMVKLLADNEPWLLKDEKYALFKEFLREKTPLPKQIPVDNQGGDDDEINVEWRLVLARRVLSVLAGMMPRFKSSEIKGDLQAIFEYLKVLPSAPSSGYQLARCLELLFDPNNVLTEANGNPRKAQKLWLQRMYCMIFEPMVEKALPVRRRANVTASSEAKDSDIELPDAEDAEAKDSDIELPDADNQDSSAKKINSSKDARKLEAASYSIALLLALRRVPVKVWEKDIPRILPMLLCVLDEFPTGTDTESALQVVLEIAKVAPHHISDHVDSIVSRCKSKIGSGSALTAPPTWMPADFHLKTGAHTDAAQQTDSRLAALTLLRIVAETQSAAKLLRVWGELKREVHMAQGDASRKVREAAQLTLDVWEKLQ